MSASILKKILKETQRELEKSKVLRKSSDLKTHSITISWIDIRRELKKELGFITATGKVAFQEYIDIRTTGGDSLKELNKVIDEQAKEIARATRKGAEQDKANFLTNAKNTRRKYPSFIAIEGTPLEFTLIIFVSKNDINPIKIWGGKKEVSGTVFSTARNYYSAQAKIASTEINAALGRAKSKKGPKVNLAHAEDSSIVQQRIDKNQSFLLDKVSKASTKDPRITAQDLKALGIDIKIEKLSKLERDIVKVTVGSEKENQREANVLQKKDLKAWKEAIEKAILKIDSKEALAERPGSDSRVNVEKKKILKRVKKKLVSSKNLKVKIEDTNIKQTKRAKGNSTVKAKVKKGTRQSIAGITGISKPGKLKGKNSSNSSVGLAALINSKLASTVANNMGAPGLENQSGRFASSARVLEVTKTNKGFPSIGYTYQKNPYQIFEKGAGKAPWATADRDPRKVIDLSIREIAAELLTGRFYTRRI